MCIETGVQRSVVWLTKHANQLVNKSQWLQRSTVQVLHFWLLLPVQLNHPTIQLTSRIQIMETFQISLRCWLFAILRPAQSLQRFSKYGRNWTLEVQNDYNYVKLCKIQLIEIDRIMLEWSHLLPRKRGRRKSPAFKWRGKCVVVLVRSSQYMWVLWLNIVKYCYSNDVYWCLPDPGKVEAIFTTPSSWPYPAPKMNAEPCQVGQVSRMDTKWTPSTGSTSPILLPPRR